MGTQQQPSDGPVGIGACSTNGTVQLFLGVLGMANGRYMLTILSREGRGSARFVWSVG